MKASQKSKQHKDGQCGKNGGQKDVPKRVVLLSPRGHIETGWEEMNWGIAGVWFLGEWKVPIYLERRGSFEVAHL